MDAASITVVNEKLFGYDRCHSCLFGTLRELNGQKLRRLVALVESQDQFALFFYECGSGDAHGVDSFSLASVCTIDSLFKLTVASTDRDSGIVTICFSEDKFDTAVEFEQGNNLADFLGKVKQAIHVYEQNKALGVTTSFDWVEKYTGIPRAQATWYIDADMNGLDQFDPFAKSSETSNDQNWMESLLTQENVGNNCPVVLDTTGTVLDHSNSTGLMQDLSDSGSYDGTSGSKSRALEKTIRRSYERSLDSLDTLKDSTTLSSEGGRDDIIRLIMKQREDDYTVLKYYRVFCGTWNVNGQQASERIHDWLCPDEDTEPPDIYAIGFQELDLSKNAYIFTESVREEDWYKRVEEALHPKARYRKLKLVRLIGMMLIVFIREELVLEVYDVMAETVGTGLLGMMGNKGGVAVRFGLRDTSICFINSHLAAHTEEFERRNQDFRDINSRMHFGSKQPPLTISDHDIVFWIGDLNYRLSDIDGETCKQMLNANRLRDLMEYDQLCRQVVMKRVFLDYLEGPITFRPTYKYDPGTDNWDTSEKCRTPAWCDRILWRGSNIRQECYRSHSKCKLSDHKPVSAIFTTGIRVIDRSKQRLIYEDVMKQLDRLENEFLPQVKLTALEVDFGSIKFMEATNNTVSVLNTGQVPVRFEFIPKPNDKQYCQPWLTVEPNKSVINVGASCEIQFEVYVDRSTASSFGLNQTKLEDILVFHLEGGKDFFLTVTGTYIPSSFGSSLEDLIYMFKPISTYSSLDAVKARAGQDKALDIPKEIWLLVDHIYQHGMTTEDLFRQPGSHSELQEIRDCLDTGSPSSMPGSVHSVAEALLLFLGSLPEPVIPSIYYHECLLHSSSFESCKMLLKEIPASHRVTFKYICAFLTRLLDFQTENKLDVALLASSFGSVLIRRKDGDAGEITRRQEMAKAMFVRYFLLNDYDD